MSIKKGKTYTIASGKGGVGKTITSVNLAIAIRLQDESTALVDGDLGMPNIGKWFDIDSTDTLHDILSDESSLLKALKQKAEGFAILPGGGDLSAFADTDPSRFAFVIDRLSREYDHVLIDSGGGLTYESAIPLQVADSIILVTSPDPQSLANTRRTKALIEYLDGSILGVVVTKTRDENELDMVSDQLDVDILGYIPFDQAVRESTEKNKPLELLAPESNAAAAFRQLGSRVVNTSISTVPNESNRAINAEK